MGSWQSGTTCEVRSLNPGLRRLLQQAGLITLPLLAVAVARLPYLNLALRLWLVALGAIAIGALSERALAGRPIHDVTGARLRWPWARPARPERVRSLEELEHAVDFSLGTAFDVHFRLRPHLRLVADHRLATRGVRLDSQSERARALLGHDAYELVRPDRQEPGDRSAGGLGLPTLRRVVEALDEL
jgi:hypothetical protein